MNIVATSLVCVYILYILVYCRHVLVLRDNKRCLTGQNRGWGGRETSFLSSLLMRPSGTLSSSKSLRVLIYSAVVAALF